MVAQPIVACVGERLRHLVGRVDPVSVAAGYEGDRNVLPARIHFVGEHLRQTGVHVLADFGLRQTDHGMTVRIDTHPAVDFIAARLARARLREFAEARGDNASIVRIALSSTTDTGSTRTSVPPRHRDARCTHRMRRYRSRTSCRSAARARGPSTAAALANLHRRRTGGCSVQIAPRVSRNAAVLKRAPHIRRRRRADSRCRKKSVSMTGRL